MPSRDPLERALTEFEGAIDNIPADELPAEVADLAEAVREHLRENARIDWAKGAGELLTRAAAHSIEIGGLPLPQVLATAQVHATLALVEQQRIANLIAVYGSTGEVESGYESRTVDFGFVVDQIREGLGL
jgi:hypothetical protein